MPLDVRDRGGRLAALLLGLVAPAAAAQPAPPPPPHLYLHPGYTPGPGPAPRSQPLTAPGAAPGPWQPLAHAAPFNPGAMIQLTDGTLMVQDQGASQNGTNLWWRLTPDAFGSYVNGTWSAMPSLPATYQPLYFASAVLPDGRVIIEGGEYNRGREAWTNKGAIFNPVTNLWKTVSPPKGSAWSRIGDAPGAVLSNGVFMLGASGYSGTTAQALLNPVKLTWTATGAGKADGNDEEGFTLLPDGRLLTVDTTVTAASPALNSEVYSPVTGAWTSAGSTVAPLADSFGEVGPAVLRPDGTVFAAGATGNTAIFNAATSTWTAGPSFPKLAEGQYDCADAPAAPLPSGGVLVAASPGVYKTPTHVFVFDGVHLNQTADPPNAGSISSFYVYMIVLPTGQILFNDRAGHLTVYNDSGAPRAAWAPVITIAPTSLTHGANYHLSGTQLGGLSQGAAYGDDYQPATNFPLVRLTMTASGHVFYARTWGMSSMSVAPGVASSVNFTLPATIETGAGALAVVANGIASAPMPVTVN